ncbi:hypothetical protein IEQ34_004066 [Dendrobium chrysotoxum]|uniref:Uncharacterized protein n=1 Tax=Dendrobium chrysotoxum TaxID=161865 RepID=A0AAV7HFL2_DENCH|nr:hypothetical protein IEQ34_004066 [Dendrobium chrysotoxum]
MSTCLEIYIITTNCNHICDKYCNKRILYDNHNSLCRVVVIVNSLNKGIASGRFHIIKPSKMAGKLLFSIDRALQVEELIHSNVVQFGMGFKTLKLFVNGGTIINLAAEGENSPVIELAVGATSDLPPMLELATGVTLTPSIPSVQSEDKKTEVKSTIEKGSSSSGALFGTKSVRKNYLRRVWKKITKSRKIAEQKALSLVELEAVEELPIPAESSIMMLSPDELVQRVTEREGELAENLTSFCFLLKQAENPDLLAGDPLAKNTNTMKDDKWRR